ncbi:MAG: M13 family metallopeptidase [Alistipes sp.]|nr:M13 family metallopeptidase [Alistipes sp.]MBQ7297214.1 M13 family metallopeptidase [Alistipes sp.]MBQ8917082.1 M13 family metallopeptidase [Alistipes sp.]
MVSCNNNTPAIDLTNLDPSIAPNEDFYQYATGGWQAKHPLKPEFARYGSFDVLRENNEIRINDLFSAMAKTTAEPGTVEQKISDLYKMGLDSVRLNNEGTAPLASDLATIEAITDRASLAAAVAAIHTSVGNPLFGLYVTSDLMNSSMNTLYISQSGLGMGDRDYYLDEEHAGKRAGYTEFLEKAFTLAGIEGGAEKAASVLAFETKMAEKFRTSVELRNVFAAYNPMSKEQFLARYKNFDWATYFATAGCGDFEQIIVEQPEVIDLINTLVVSEQPEVIKNYLTAHLLQGAAGYLGDELYALSFDFFGRQMSGTTEMKPRWKRAMAVPNSILSEAVGEMYVAKYFPEEDKVRMLALVKNLQTALGQHIEALEWMSDETKAKALEKLATFTVKIGYPDKWKDYSSLTIDPTKSYWENIKQASAWYTADNFAKLGKEVDRAEWHMPPQMVNAYYNPTTNEICFPAAILQPPFYNPTADDAVNYGAIGVVIGHEMTHGFDDQGRNFDKDGNMKNWWTEADAEAFQKKSQVLVEQFDKIEVLPAKDDQPAIFANGSLSLGENIADQGGLRVAYTALQNALNGTEPAPIDGFTAAQRFYLAYATLWGQNIRDEEIARLTKLDVHSLGKNRVNATLKNIQSFYDAFGITEGAMFLPEEERVIIW